MLKRIVKLTFQVDKIDDFYTLFELRKREIRNFRGCHHLELLQDVDHPNILFTFSLWENEAALEAYRHSAFFQKTWADTKLLFSDKPQAWSVKVVSEI